LQSLAQIQKANPTTPLPVAVATGKARVSIHGTGASSGDSVKIDVSKGPNAPPGEQILTIPPGTVLENSNSAGQGMVVAEVRGRVVSESMYEPASRIELAGKGVVTYILSAFCMEFEKENPSNTDSFDIRTPDPKLACILKNSSKLSVPTRQAAVWIHTDHVTYDQMSQKFPVTVEEFNQGQALVDRCQ
jgi:hypothetical protein